MKESKVFTIKSVGTGKLTNLRKITFVCRQKEFYQKNSIALWWKKSYGVGIIGKPNKQLKYFMIGMSLFGILCWLDFKWVGNCKKRQPLEGKDGSNYL